MDVHTLPRSQAGPHLLGGDLRLGCPGLKLRGLSWRGQGSHKEGREASCLAPGALVALLKASLH